MTRLCTDLKVIPRSCKGHKSILVVIDEVTDFMVTIPICQSRSEEIEDALMEHVLTKYSLSQCMIIKQDSAFMSTLINCFFMKLGTKIKKVATYDDQSLLLCMAVLTYLHYLTCVCLGV